MADLLTLVDRVVDLVVNSFTSNKTPTMAALAVNRFDIADTTFPSSIFFSFVISKSSAPAPTPFNVGNVFLHVCSSLAIPKSLLFRQVKRDRKGVSTKHALTCASE